MMPKCKVLEFLARQDPIAVHRRHRVVTRIPELPEGDAAEYLQRGIDPHDVHRIVHQPRRTRCHRASKVTLALRSSGSAAANLLRGRSSSIQAKAIQVAETGEAHPLTGQVWTEAPIAMAAVGDYLYVIEAATLYKVDPLAPYPPFPKLTEAIWTKAPIAMTSFGDSMLCILESGRLWTVDVVTGERRQLSPGYDWTEPPIAMASTRTDYRALKNRLALSHGTVAQRGEAGPNIVNGSRIPVAVESGQLIVEFAPGVTMSLAYEVDGDTRTLAGTIKQEQQRFDTGQIAVATIGTLDIEFVDGQGGGDAEGGNATYLLTPEGTVLMRRSQTKPGRL